MTYVLLDPQREVAVLPGGPLPSKSPATAQELRTMLLTCGNPSTVHICSARPTVSRPAGVEGEVVAGVGGSAAARWVSGSRHCDRMTCGSCRGLAWPSSTETSGRLRTLPVPAKSSPKAATATLAAWAERHQHAIAVSRRHTTAGSAAIRQIKFFSYRTDSGALFRARCVFDPGLKADGHLGGRSR